MEVFCEIQKGQKTDFLNILSLYLKSKLKPAIAVKIVRDRAKILLPNHTKIMTANALIATDLGESIFINGIRLMLFLPV